MPQITKPNTLNRIWADGGDKATPLDSKINSGWQIEIPPRQWFNWLDNRQDQAIAHINQHGIAVWDNVTEYQANKSYVQDPSNGVIYRCLATNIGNLPSSSPTFWAVAFADAASAFSEGQADLKYLTKSQNFADVPNKNAARDSLSVYSQAQVNNLISQAVANIPTTSLGVGQTWQNLTTSRITGATYTNTTGRPILVNVSTSQAGGDNAAAISLTVGGVLVARSVTRFSAFEKVSFVSALVPAGATYVASNLGGSLYIWAELR